MKKAVIIFLLAGAAQPALAREKPYAGFDYTQATFSTANAEPEYSALRVKVGGEFSQYLGFEYQGAMGLGMETSTLPTGTIDSKLRGLIGFYLRPKLELGDSFALYALGGYSWSRVQLNVNIPGMLSRTETQGDFSAGIGAEAKVFGDSFLSVDYMEYSEGLTAVSAGIRIPF